MPILYPKNNLWESPQNPIPTKPRNPPYPYTSHPVFLFVRCIFFLFVMYSVRQKNNPLGKILYTVSAIVADFITKFTVFAEENAGYIYAANFVQIFGFV